MLFSHCVSQWNLCEQPQSKHASAASQENTAATFCWRVEGGGGFPPPQHFRTFSVFLTEAKSCRAVVLVLYSVPCTLLGVLGAAKGHSLLHGACRTLRASRVSEPQEYRGFCVIGFNDMLCLVILAIDKKFPVEILILLNASPTCAFKVYFFTIPFSWKRSSCCFLLLITSSKTFFFQSSLQ